MRLSKNQWATNLCAISAAALLAAAFASGCSSSSDTSDGAVTDAGSGGSSGGDGGGSGGATDGPTPYGITPGTYCFKITAIEPGFTDGCDIQVDMQVGKYLPVK